MTFHSNFETRLREGVPVDWDAYVENLKGILERNFKEVLVEDKNEPEIVDLSEYDIAAIRHEIEQAKPLAEKIQKMKAYRIELLEASYKAAHRSQKREQLDRLFRITSKKLFEITKNPIYYVNF